MKQHIIVGRLKINDKESGINDTYVFRAKRLKMVRKVCPKCGDISRSSYIRGTWMQVRDKDDDGKTCRFCKGAEYVPHQLFGIKLYTTVPNVVDGVKLLCGKVPVLVCNQYDRLGMAPQQGTFGLNMKKQNVLAFSKWPRKRADLYKVFVDGGPVPAYEQMRLVLETMEVHKEKKKMAEWSKVKIPTNEELTEIYELYEKAKFAEVL